MSKYNGLHIGILALQGDFERHQHQLEKLHVKSSLVKLPGDLEKIDGLIMPGGESTTMDKLIDRFGLREPLREFGTHKPIWGTCAGMIMLSDKIEKNQSAVKPLGLLDIDVERNAYGRQVFSFETELEAPLNGKNVSFKASFIRAPKVKRVGEKVKILAEYNGEPVLVQNGKILSSSFHTELEDETILLEYFLNNFFVAEAGT